MPFPAYSKWCQLGSVFTFVATADPSAVTVIRERMTFFARDDMESVGRLGKDFILYPDHAHQLFHRVGAFVKRGLLFAREFDLDDLLDSP